MITQGKAKFNAGQTHPGEPEAKAVRIGDLRFRTLLGEDAWAKLPAAVQKRFCHKTGPGETILYTGIVTRCDFSRTGLLLAQVCRLIGSPFPTRADIGTAAVVSVTEHAGSGGQVWTRLYANRKGFPQVIHSSKRFAGPTGLEEHVGCGFGMTLNVGVEEQSLVFRSERYFWQLPFLRIYLPRFMTPGKLAVHHTPVNDRRFVFTLHVEHSWLGCLIHQDAEFNET